MQERVWADRRQTYNALTNVDYLLALVIYVVATVIFAVLMGKAVIAGKDEIAELSDAVTNLKAAVKSAAKQDWERIRSLARRFTN